MTTVPIRLAPALAVVALLLGGCTMNGRGPYEASSEAARNPLEAQRLTMDAADLIDRGDNARAEHLLRQALTADLYHGPAHNNLGVVYLMQGKLYEAAGEFEWARKLMPGHPEPRTNLALTLERAGRREDAIATYRTALDVAPGHIQTMQGLARAEVRAGVQDTKTDALFAEIAMRGTSERWREWARGRLALKKE